MTTTRLGIGIDTGGTFTDAVAVDLGTMTPVASAKRPTTHHDLSRGIAAALGALLDGPDIEAANVDLAAVSTTLATNTVVEGKGARVGLIVIGSTRNMPLPVVDTRYVTGGHTITGEEDKPLDIETLLAVIEDFTPRVDAFAVCSAMSFTNPAHELIAEKAISLAAPDKPVFCSHRASGRSGLRERAATAVLNARLMPIMDQFIASIEQALGETGLTCPVTVIRGDAQGMAFEEARVQAAETFASGPAASVRFGLTARDIPDALVVDVGGTTTDIALIQDRRPAICEGGIRIGQWETHVQAMEMYTVGMGGDSFIRIDEQGNLLIGPTRVQPLCMTPEAPAPGQWLQGAERSKLLLPVQGASTAIASPILEHLQHVGSGTHRSVMDALGMSAFAVERDAAELVRHEAIVETGFTPTDALHVLGQLDLGDVTKAREAAAILAEIHGSSAEEFCRLVLAKVRDGIRLAIIEHLARKEGTGAAADYLAHRPDKALLSIKVGLNIPMVGLGAASQLLLPEVGNSLGTETLFPEQYEIGNALGAILLAAEAAPSGDE